MKTFFLAILLACWSHAIGQSVTASIAVDVRHNTSSTPNSSVTYRVDLSTGWQNGINLISTMTLKNQAGTTIYTHLGILNNTNYGTISNLAPGYYKFTGSVTALNLLGLLIAVPISKEFWVGHDVEFEQSFDMAKTVLEHTVERDQTSAAVYGHVRSFNALASGASGWMEVAKAATTTSDSRLFWVLETLPDPSIFNPADNISYVEFYHQDATTKGIRLKYKQTNGTYTTTTLSTSEADKIRFVRASNGTCTLQKNDALATIFTFPVTITGELQMNLLAKQLHDQASHLLSSFGFPSATLPLSSTFDNANDQGTITWTIVPPNGAVAPYHYFVAKDPIPELKDVYQSLRDSTGTPDSTLFFLGSQSGTTYTSNPLAAGSYYISAFDSRGVRIYSGKYHLAPPFSYDANSGIIASGNNLIATTSNAYATWKEFLTTDTDASLTYTLMNTGTPQAFGAVKGNETINGGTAMYSKLAYGFYVDNNQVRLVENGILSSTNVAATAGMPLRLSMSGGQMTLTAGTLTNVFTPVAGVSLKGGVIFRDPAGRTPLTRDGTPLYSETPLTFAVGDNACGKTTGDLTITYPVTSLLGFPIGSYNFRLYNRATGNVVGVENQSFFNDLAIGIYSIEGTTTVLGVTSAPIKRIIYVGAKMEWENYQRFVTWPSNPANTNYAVADNTVSTTNRAIGYGQNKLAAGSAGWVVFTPHVPVTTGKAFLMLTPSPNGSTTMSTLLSADAPSVRISGDHAVVYTGVGTKPLPNYDKTKPLLIEREIDGTVHFRQDDATLLSNPHPGQPSPYDFVRWRPSVVIEKADIGFNNVLSSSQCSATLIPPVFADLKYEMDGYYHTMKNGKICFVFDQEYDHSNLKFNIYSAVDVLIRTQADFPPVATTHGTNYTTIDITGAYCIGKGMFYLEVINSKNEKLYLRFYNDYDPECLMPGGSTGGDTE